MSRSTSGIDTTKTTKELLNQAYLVNKNLSGCTTTERVLITDDIEEFKNSSNAVYNDVKAEFDEKKNEIMQYVDVEAQLTKLQTYIDEKTEELNAAVDESIHKLEDKVVELTEKLATKMAQVLIPGTRTPKNPIEELQDFVTKTKETIEYTRNVTLTSLQLMQSSILAGIVSSANKNKKKRDAKKAQKEYNKQQRLNAEMDAKKKKSTWNKAKKHYDRKRDALVLEARKNSKAKSYNELTAEEKNTLNQKLQQAYNETQELFNINLETGEYLHETE